MNAGPGNPFNVTKAVDFTSQQISDFWVDIPGDAGFGEMVKPTSPMPMLILGAKGSGKTHLMRYFSFALQRIRHAERGLGQGIAADGYLGIYLRCGGLNAARFAGKGKSDEAWIDVFAYYMDLWLGQLVLNTAQVVLSHTDGAEQLEQAVHRAAASLFDIAPTGPETLDGLLQHLSELQRALDIAINNAALSDMLDVRISVTRGSLVFGLPQLLAGHVPVLANCVFLYLIDEFENLSLAQQRYVNTLLREKEPPVSFKIGARTYGVRTYATYSADEENKEGSEYECLRLDDRLRQNDQYAAFAKRLVVRRLTESGLYTTHEESDSDLTESLSDCFQRPGEDRFSTEETSFVLNRVSDRERPYFERLRRNLIKALPASKARGISTESDIEYLLDALRCPQYPLLEKACTFRMYQEWRRRTDLRSAADRIHVELQSFLDGRTSGLDTVLSHFRADLLAQLRRDFAMRPRYVGIDTFVDISWGVPRNLLVLLKHVFAWALFRGEAPFHGTPISYEAQEKGILEAAEWFFRDTRMIGRDGSRLQASVQRLAELFKALRFSDKPAECSCPAFSGDITSCSEETRRLIEMAVQWSLLIRDGSQRNRNTGRLDPRYQLNRMLAARWDLPIYRRGVLSLTSDEVDAVFQGGEQYERVVKARLARVNAPFESNGAAEQGDDGLFGAIDV